MSFIDSGEKHWGVRASLVAVRRLLPMCVNLRGNEIVLSLPRRGNRTQPGVQPLG